MLALPATPGMSGLGPYPTDRVFAQALKRATQHERAALARLWLSEGIPKVFELCPVAYEYYRVHLAAAARVAEKDVTVVGSLRFGYSLAPAKYGSPLTAKSDLDAAIVDERLFRSAEKAFNDWQANIAAGRTAPSNPREAGFWSEAARLVPTQLTRGFVGTKFLPASSPFVRSLHDPLVAIIAKWRTMNGTPKLNAASSSVRIYRDWQAALRQIAINLDQLARSLP